MRKNVLKRLLTYTRPYRHFLVFSLLSAVISVVLTLLGPILIGEAVDFIVGPGEVNFAGLPRILLLLACTALGAAGFQWLTAYFNNIISYRTVKDLRIQLFGKLSHVPLSYIDQTKHGDIINRIVNDIDFVSDGLLQGFTQLFTGVATIVGTLLFMLSENWKITVVVVLLTPLSMFVAGFIAKGCHKYFSEQTRTQGALSGYVEELLGEQKLVKAFCYEERAQDGLEEINAKLYRCGKKAHFYSAMANPCTRFVNNIIYAVVGIIGAVSVIGGIMSVGQMTVFLTYANQYTKPFNEISGIVTHLQAAFASAKRVFEVIDAEVEEEPYPEQGGSCKGRVEINEVSFSYSPAQSLIEGLNLEVKPGNRIAIVGPTGCGKTTVINLLMRFYDVKAGEIRVDGNDIREMNRNDLRRKFGMVLQETWLFSGTVRENIAYGMPEATEEQVIMAAKAAYAHSFIRRLPKGYDTVISADGGNLSQGQKQLLCIARVMLLDPPMLILDEATSNIDTRTEIKVQRAFQKMMEGRTSFVVAHRLSTIREADVILVMEKGHIVEQGNHQELIQKGGFYAGLYQTMTQ